MIPTKNELGEARNDDRLADRQLAGEAGRHHHGMVIDMNEAQVRTVETMQQVLAGTQALKFRQAQDNAGRLRLDRRRATTRGLRPVDAPVARHSARLSEAPEWLAARRSPGWCRAG